MRDKTLASGHAKNAILDSSVRLFFHQGYNQTSIQQVVEDAGLTKGAFYYYFDSKEDLLIQIHDSYLDVELAEARKVVDKGLSPEETLRGLVVAMVETVIQYRDHVTIWSRERTSLTGAHKSAVRKIPALA